MHAILRTWTLFASFPHRDALQIGAGDYRPSIVFPNLCDGTVQVERADVAEDELSCMCRRRDSADQGGRSVPPKCLASADRQMHHQHVGVGRELREVWILAALIASEHDRSLSRSHAVRDRRNVRMWHRHRRDRDAVPIEYRGMSLSGRIHDRDLEGHRGSRSPNVALSIGNPPCLPSKSRDRNVDTLGTESFPSGPTSGNGSLRATLLNHRSAGRSDT